MVEKSLQVGGHVISHLLQGFVFLPQRTGFKCENRQQINPTWKRHGTGIAITILFFSSTSELIYVHLISPQGENIRVNADENNILFITKQKEKQMGKH